MNGPRFLRMVGLLLVLGLMLSVLAACAGADGAVGDRGPQGAAGNNGADGQDGQDGREGAAGPMVDAGIKLTDSVFSLEARGSVTVTGWGFNAGETVLITIQTDVRDEILMGPDANAYGAFEKTQSAKRVSIAGSTTPGVYTVRAEGSEGTIATTYLTIVESTK